MDEQTERENQLILSLVQEGWTFGIDQEVQGLSDEELVEGFRHNHQSYLIHDAANGDVIALVQLRQDIGLPPIR